MKNVIWNGIIKITFLKKHYKGLLVFFCLFFLYAHSCWMPVKRIRTPLPHRLQEIPFGITYPELRKERPQVGLDTGRAYEDWEGPPNLHISYMFDLDPDFTPRWIWSRFSNLKRIEASYGKLSPQDSRQYLYEWLSSLGRPDRVWEIDYQNQHGHYRYLFFQWKREGLKFEMRFNLLSKKISDDLYVAIYYKFNLLKPLTFMDSDHMTPISFEEAQKMIEEVSSQTAEDQDSK